MCQVSVKRAIVVLLNSEELTAAEIEPRLLLIVWRCAGHTRITNSTNNKCFIFSFRLTKQS